MDVNSQSVKELSSNNIILGSRGSKTVNKSNFPCKNLRRSFSTGTFHEKDLKWFTNTHKGQKLHQSKMKKIDSKYVMQGTPGRVPVVLQPSSSPSGPAEDAHLVSAPWGEQSIEIRGRWSKPFLAETMNIPPEILRVLSFLPGHTPNNGEVNQYI